MRTNLHFVCTSPKRLPALHKPSPNLGREGEWSPDTKARSHPMKNYLGSNRPTQLRVAIARGGLTQRALAELSGVDEYLLSTYATGRRTPSVKTASKLISTLAKCGVRVTLEELCLLPQPHPHNKEIAAMSEEKERTAKEHEP